MNTELKEAEAKLDKMLATLSPSLKTILIGYFLSLELNEIEAIPLMNDEVMLRKAQGKALGYRGLVKKFSS